MIDPIICEDGSLTTTTTEATRPATPPAAPSQLGAFARGANDIPRSFVERMELAQFLAHSDIIPRALQGNAANVLLVMHKALALDVPLTVALEHINVIDGQVEESAELLRGLVYRHGHQLRWTTTTSTEATGEIVLVHDPSVRRQVTFTMRDAQRMGLADKSNWKTDPESMLIARCTSRLISRYCPEVALSLGNLSRMDMPPEAPAVSPEDEVAAEQLDTEARERAETLWGEAQKATTAAEVTKLGKRANKEGLAALTVGADRRPLRELLLARVTELAPKAEQEATAQIIDTSGPAPESVAAKEEVPAAESTLDEHEGGPLECGCDAAEVFRTGSHADGCEQGRAPASPAKKAAPAKAAAKTATSGKTRTAGSRRTSPTARRRQS